MKKNSLEKLISDLDHLSKNIDNLLDKKYDNIMARLFVLIGKTTAYDTGVSRNIIKSILSDLGRPDLQSELEHEIFEFWRKKRDRERDNVKYTFNKQNGRYKIEIEDYGIGNQEAGKVSDIHPRQDSRVIPHHVDMALDKLETDGDKDMVSAFNELESFICKLIEKGV